MIPWTVAHQAPLSMGFFREEYQSGLPFPSPGYLPGPGIKPQSPALWADSLPSEPPRKPSQCLCCAVLHPSGVSDSLGPHGPARLLCPWDSLDKKTGVSSHSLLQGIFPTQGSNLGLLYCRQILYHLSHQGSCSMSVDSHILLGLVGF